MANHPNRGRRKVCIAPPKPEEILALQDSARLTDAQCAELVCVTESTWWRWAIGELPMPAGAWKLFRICVGKLSTVPPTAAE